MQQGKAERVRRQLRAVVFLPKHALVSQKERCPGGAFIPLLPSHYGISPLEDLPIGRTHVSPLNLQVITCGQTICGKLPKAPFISDAIVFDFSPHPSRVSPSSTTQALAVTCCLGFPSYTTVEMILWESFSQTRDCPHPRQLQTTMNIDIDTCSSTQTKDEIAHP